MEEASRHVCFDLDLLPAALRRSYATMRELDNSLQVLLRQNEERCEEEIHNLKQGIESGRIKPGPSTIRFSEEAIDEQKHCARISDEKVAMAIRAYDIVDTQIQQLDQFLRKYEEIRQEKEIAAAGGTGSNADGSTRSTRGESSKGGRKKTRQAVAEPTSVNLDLPVDPNEPTYCFCNQVSFGEMVACDNPDDRMVSLWVRRLERTAEGEVVLFYMCRNQEVQERQVELDKREVVLHIDFCIPNRVDPSGRPENQAFGVIQ